MGTKKNVSQIEMFTQNVESLGTELLNEDKGYLMFVYNEMENGNTESVFASRGKLNCIAECLFACMKQNPVLANVVIAASNAVVQSRMMEAKITEETYLENKTPKVVS